MERGQVGCMSTPNFDWLTGCIVSVSGRFRVSVIKALRSAQVFITDDVCSFHCRYDLPYNRLTFYSREEVNDSDKKEKICDRIQTELRKVGVRV